MHRHNLFTSNFRGILVFFVKLAVLLGILLGLMLYISPQYSQGYNASLIDKVNRLESIEGPKIVLIGNSNLAFGIKSEEIEAAFGMPVINMGLHDGLENPFHEQMARLNVQEGDIYIICHSEYSSDEIGADLAWVTIEDHFELWRLLRKKDILPMARAYPAYFKDCLNLWIQNTGNQMSANVYSRGAFNVYGDIEWEDSGLVYEFKEGSVTVPLISDETVDRLNDLNQYLMDRDATMLIAGYPIADTPFTPAREEYEAFQKELASKLDAPVISDFREYFFPIDYFFDTNVHLNNVGKKARTQQLISDLQGYFEETYAK